MIRPLTRPKIRRIPPLLIGLLLSACAAEPVAVTEPPPIGVAREEQRLPLAVDPGGVIRTPSGALKAFVERWRDEGWGPLTIEAPSLPVTAHTRLQKELTDRVRRAGGDADAVALAPPGTGSYGVWLRFDRAVAVLPDCQTDIHRFGQSADNPGPSFGCATRRNLGAMVANPADLVDPRLEEGGNAARGAAVIGNHRKGPSAAQSTGQGNGSMSAGAMSGSQP